MKARLLITYLFVFYATISNCQIAKCVVYFDKDGVECLKDSAKSKIIIKKSKTNSFRAWEYKYSNLETCNGWYERSCSYILLPDLTSAGSYYFRRVYDISCNADREIFDEKSHKVSFIKADSSFYLKIFNPEGILIQEGNSRYIYPFVWHGIVKEYNDDGSLKNEKLYSNNKLFETKRFNSNGEVLTDIHEFKDLDSGNLSFKDTTKLFENELMRLLSHNTHYPKEALDKCIMGRVFISLIITKESKYESFLVIYGVHPLIDNAALEAVKIATSLLPEIEPPKVDNLPVNLHYIVPVNFTIYCFNADTEILMSDKSLKDISKIESGEFVLTYDENTSTLVESEVSQKIQVPHDNLVKLYFSDREIVVTDDHPFYTDQKQWASINPESSNISYIQKEEVVQLNIGAKIFLPNENRYAELLKIEKITESQMTYTLLLKTAENFIANGLMVKTEVVKPERE